MADRVTGSLLSRRRLLQVGGIGAFGLSLPQLLRAEAAANSAGSHGVARPKSCIFVFLYGGPSQLDTWDMKPHVPAEIRGEFQPIETTVPGTWICEHLPRLAQLARRYSIVRTLHHNNRNHSPASGWALTGFDPNTTDDPKKLPGPNDPPALGSLAARLAPSRTGMPSFVHLPARLYFDPGLYFLGQAAGWLGTAYDPLLIQQDPNSPSFRIEEFAGRQEVPPERIGGRRRLLQALGTQTDASTSHAAMQEYQRRALDLLTSNAGRTAFDLLDEPDRVRERYGRTMLGQGCLLARRLIEAGVRLVTVADCTPNGHQQWDTHARNFVTLKTTLLPRLDQAASALLEDLLDRGLLEDTVVYLGGEFGRTPRIGEKVAGGAESDGRDHWSDCFSGLLAGGHTRPGITYGTSDRIGGYPLDSAMTPEDLGATIFRAMGLDPATLVTTISGRPVQVSTGEPAAALLE